MVNTTTTGKVIAHGTLSGYKSGCRCNPCKQVRKEYDYNRR